MHHVSVARKFSLAHSRSMAGKKRGIGHNKALFARHTNGLISLTTKHCRKEVANSYRPLKPSVLGGRFPCTFTYKSNALREVPS